MSQATAKKKNSRTPFYRNSGILQRRKLSETRCTAEGMPDVIRELNEYHPDLICLRKNCIVRIALYAQEHNLTIRQPKWYIPVSEMVDEMTRMTLEKTFGPGLVDAYGSDETGSCIINGRARITMTFAMTHTLSTFMMTKMSLPTMAASSSRRCSRLIFH